MIKEEWNEKMKYKEKKQKKLGKYEKKKKNVLRRKIESRI